MKSVTLIIFAALLAGCGAQMRTLPVGAGHSRVNASLGGPFVDAFNTTIPMPYGVVGVSRGLSDRCDAYCDLHLTAAAFKFFGATPGVVYFPRVKWQRFVPGVGACALLFSDFRDTRIYPEIVTSLAYRTESRWTPYVVIHHTLPLTPNANYIPSAMLGTAVKLGALHYFAELDWLALDRDNRWNPVDYHGISERGALGIQFGAALDLRRKGGAK
jgi:hypothetical protein